jgi:hypothetical protein
MPDQPASWHIPRRERWPYPQGDNSPDPRRPWSRVQYQTYWTARDQYILTGNADALAVMLEHVDGLPEGAEYRG